MERCEKPPHSITSDCLALSSFLQDEFSALFNDRAPPPASKKFLEEEVPDKTIRDEGKEGIKEGRLLENVLPNVNLLLTVFQRTNLNARSA